jgi:RHS repeat-associated protein
LSRVNRISRRTGQIPAKFSWDLNAPLPTLTSIDHGAVDTAYRYDPTGAPVWINANGTQASLFTDALGSIKQAVIGAANSAWTTSYEPFGRPRNATNDELNAGYIGLGFTGQYADPFTGLLHLRLRDYDTSEGRFTAVDPVAAPLGAPAVSPYAYVNNQPTVHTDPTGACPWCVDLVGDAVVGIAGTINDEGMPNRGELQGGFGIGIAQAAESTAHSFIGGSNPWGLTNTSGWDGNWVTDKIKPYNHGWFHGATIAGQIGFHVGVAAASIPFGTRTTAATITNRICPPNLLAPRIGATGSKASDIAAGLTRPVTLLGRYYGGTQNYKGKPGFRILDMPPKGPGRWNWTRNKRFVDEAL